MNALTAVGKLISKSFVNALTEPVLKLLTHNTDIVRKKVINNNYIGTYGNVNY